MAANATFALKPGVWFLRVRFVIFAPDSRREPSPPSGRKSTRPTVQILEARSVIPRRWVVELTFAWMTRWRRLVLDYEERIDCSEAMIHVALGSVLLRRIAHQ